MANNSPETQPPRIPAFIQRQLENPQILPGESKREFNWLFREIEFSAEGGKKTAADYLVDYQATMLTWNLQRIDRMIIALIRHMRPKAVVALATRTTSYGEVESGSVAYRQAYAEAVDYFTSEDAKKLLLERFARGGYAPEAVEVEAFDQALAQITNLNHQQTVARRQLLAFLKDIDRRNSRRADELRTVADNAIARGRASATGNGATS